MCSILYVFLVSIALTCVGIVSTYECSKDRCWNGLDRTDASAILAAGLMATKIVPCLLLVFNMREFLCEDKDESDDWTDVITFVLFILSIPAATLISIVGYVGMRACLHGTCWSHVDANGSLAMLVCAQALDLVYALIFVVVVVDKPISSVIKAIIKFFAIFRKRKVLPITNYVNA